MIIRCDSAEISTSIYPNKISIILSRPDFSNIKKEDMEVIIKQFNDSETVIGIIKDILGKEAIQEYLNK